MLLIVPLLPSFITSPWTNILKILINPCLNSFGGCMNYLSDVNLSHFMYNAPTYWVPTELSFSLYHLTSNVTSWGLSWSPILCNIVSLFTTQAMLFNCNFITLFYFFFVLMAILKMLKNWCEKLVDGKINHVLLNMEFFLTLQFHYLDTPSMFMVNHVWIDCVMAYKINIFPSVASYFSSKVFCWTK